MDRNLPLIRIFFGEFSATMDHIQNTHSDTQNELVVIIAVAIHSHVWKLHWKLFGCAVWILVLWPPKLTHSNRTERNQINSVITLVFLLYTSVCSLVVIIHRQIWFCWKMRVKEPTIYGMLIIYIFCLLIDFAQHSQSYSKTDTHKCTQYDRIVAIVIMMSCYTHTHALIATICCLNEQEAQTNERTDGQTSSHINYQFVATNTQRYHHTQQCYCCFSLSLSPLFAFNF